ncbi:MAG TPA: helix-turn-helix transcriptional regulator, partial [Bordetella sp.]
ELPAMKAATAYFAEQALVSLLAAAYCESVSAAESSSDTETDRWLRLVAFIDANLDDANLSVERIAHELKVSKRWVHRLFESHGQQYSAYLRQLRLQHAREELESDRLRHLSVTEIGLRNGFRDSSHFSRSFREHYGIPPSSYRQASP